MRYDDVNDDDDDDDHDGGGDGNDNDKYDMVTSSKTH
jgi:hypothetical protein